MKKPRFTDEYRFTSPYRHAKDTDISKTFAAEKKRLAEAAAAKAESNVHPLAGIFKANKK